MFDVPKPVLLVRMHYNQFGYRMYPIECALENLLSGEDLIFYANTEYLTETPEDAEINYNRIKEVHGIPRNVNEGRGFLPMQITAFINEYVDDIQMEYTDRKPVIAVTSRQDYNYLTVCVFL
ncbi:hypothetical protein AVEN_39726-1 [Araneus ventricosus]|uniref:Uncharacterized protein n=1 Tax=Araneus ventricosus TaxID=182803 RepID=A0A4Y2LVI4_ARAVE|nr:hypothetical protein AVEN_39726-1 [Araneus ventricosus]